ncbi:GNAT family N-acetyltransferase [Haloarcula litorea]|uniref:GNAT family N-acetyltransferase n=1 Tax=Haloarcula litorea TaxID=3032579 RepID=UPI0023E82EB0|nr:GNAT family N-acetyltransferase [Halomicroarcula sp. GDY20]
MDQPPGSVREFPRPPREATDREGRTVTAEAYDGDADPLVEMYTEFDAGSRSQGVPPRTESAIREWVAGLLEDGLNVVVRHAGRVVGHAVLVPHDDDAELAIFVHPDYQSAGNGSLLIEALLGYGQEHGLEHVWLTVSHDNRIAIKLYDKVGFETRMRDRTEYEMERPL